jgi:CheY-like chemotaxis protein
MDGLTAIQQIRQLEEAEGRGRHIPCIAVTGNARKEQVDLCLESGFDATAIKPYKMKELLGQIELVMDTS